MDLFLGQTMEVRVQKKKRETGEWVAVDAKTKPLLELQTRLNHLVFFFITMSYTLIFYCETSDICQPLCQGN
ncbi:hypothetical protein LR48_Vigan751s000300 [Vigna angularis]|uniref:Uncharacterized protein n=1 Tax=Phaseolus angularis TaxID=3914 RepID=A0A0L9TGQ5_PHAAN|nr:hypothetical protein LR48_Vigan751s000300 [Vigna angularis]